MESKEKRTGKFGRFMGWMVSILVIVALTWGFVTMYPRMTQEARNVYSEHVQNKKRQKLEDYVKQVYQLIDGMYVDWYNQENQDGKNAGEILLGEYHEVGTNYTTWYALRKDSLSEWYKNTYREEVEKSGIKYFIYSGTSNNGYGNLDPLMASEKAENYPLLIKLYFNKYGIPVLEEARGIENAENYIMTGYEERRKSNQMYDYSSGEMIEHGAIADITVLLACEEGRYEELIQNVTLSTWTLQDAISEMRLDYTVFVLAAIAIVIFLGLLLPTIRPLGLREGWKANIPAELLVFAGAVIILLIADYLPELAVKSRIEMEYPGMFFYWIGIMKDIMADGREKYFILGANVVVWFVSFFVVYLCTLNLRQLFVKGVVMFLKENTLTGRILCFLFSWVKKTVEFCGTIDFSNKGNRNFFLAVVLNFIIIALLCCGWFFGILLAIPYSLLVFWLLQKWWNKIRTDYVVMLSTTEEMARGITDVQYVAESGIFYELKGALSGVQEGFHAAVQEEVKSQKMKTELITNVSHDLKTPLTAIITYVDLLKNENLSPEERKNYVEILERKSTRLKTLIEDLFEISKAASGDMKLDKVNLDLVQLIQEVQLELEEEIMNSGVVVKVSLPQEKVMVHLDAQKTGRIFENLTTNILKHALTGSRAYISMEQTDKDVKVIYKNISAAEINYDAEEILERFTRGDASRNTEGSGLGLAIVKSFTEAQGGKVKVDLSDDMFKVTLSFQKMQTASAPAAVSPVEQTEEAALAEAAVTE